MKIYDFMTVRKGKDKKNPWLSPFEEAIRTHHLENWLLKEKKEHLSCLSSGNRTS